MLEGTVVAIDERVEDDELWARFSSNVVESCASFVDVEVVTSLELEVEDELVDELVVELLVVVVEELSADSGP